MNLYVWPANDASERSFIKDGVKVSEWSRNGMRFAAVFDVTSTRLRALEELLQKQ